MTSADEDEDEEEGEDEGIEDGYEVRQTGLCGVILELCRHHLAAKSEAESHYRAVCRALVAEALEISSFMEKMGDANNNEELRELAMGDWANIWSDVMGQLRRGIKLRKVEYSKTPTEFELTPYEMLMADIRKKSYKLNPTTLPLRVKTDAKDVILDFIRSRPPLKPASKRVLPPRKKDSTPMELLLEEIRSTDASKSLKKTNFPNPTTTSAIRNASSKKKAISPDLCFFEDILNFDDESPHSPAKLKNSNASCHSPDLVKVKSENNSKLSQTHARSRTKVIKKPLLVKLPEHEHYKPGVPQPKLKSTSRSESVVKTENLDLVKLSLFEFSHIRTQETKAELDGYICSLEKKRDLEQGKICFSCKNVRFKLINWAYDCKICKKNVCSKCFIKLRLPEEKLKDVTVASLISQLSPSNESKPRDNNFSEQSPADNQLSMGTSLVRASLGRMSLRSRPGPAPTSENPPKSVLFRSKTTLGKEDILKAKSINMLQRTPQATKIPEVPNSRPKMIRSNTALSSKDLEGIKLKNKTQLGAVCLTCKNSLVQTIRTMSMRCRETRKIIPGLKI
jgi:spire-like protein